MSGKAKKRSLIYESVLEHIKGELRRGTLNPGDRLPTVSDMANQLGISVASVREAYRVLETLGILSVTQGRGTFVSSTLNTGSVLSQLEFAEQQSIAHLFEARKLLEPQLAAMAAEKASKAEHTAIMAAAEEMEQLYRTGQDYIEPDVRFHELIVQAVHNPILSRILSKLDDLLLDSRRLTCKMPGSTEKAIYFHKLIALAIRDGNAEAARVLMYQHIDDVERSLMDSDPAAYVNRTSMNR